MLPHFRITASEWWGWSRNPSLFSEHILELIFMQNSENCISSALNLYSSKKPQLTSFWCSETFFFQPPIALSWRSGVIPFTMKSPGEFLLSYYHCKKNQSGRFSPVCNRIFGKQFELHRMGKMYFMECNETESLLGGMRGSYIRYSKVEPHWSAFWSNYIDIWSLKKCIACSLWIFSKTFFS